MSGLVKGLLRRLESTECQINDIRRDYANFETENSHSLKKAKKEIEEKSADLKRMEAEAANLLDKNTKLKANNEVLQTSIEEHRKANEELQASLKKENKTNCGKVYLALQFVRLS